jgi:hypothetical protein
VRRALKRQQSWAAGLTTRETLEKAEAEVRCARKDSTPACEIRTREEQVRQQEAGLSALQPLAVVFRVALRRHVTRRNIEEGENVVVAR